jgi:hypothetical protein
VKSLCTLWLLAASGCFVGATAGGGVAGGGGDRGAGINGKASIGYWDTSGPARFGMGIEGGFTSTSGDVDASGRYVGVGLRSDVRLHQLASGNRLAGTAHLSLGMGSLERGDVDQDLFIASGFLGVSHDRSTDANDAYRTIAVGPMFEWASGDDSIWMLGLAIELSAGIDIRSLGDDRDDD